MTRSKHIRPVNVCQFCGKRIIVSPGKGVSWGWTKGDAFGIECMIQVHHECLFAEFDKLKTQEVA